MLIQLSLITFFSLLIPVISAPMHLHIALNGSDQAGGSTKQPFASLERARDQIRDLKKSHQFPKDGVTVWMHGGTYTRDQSFELKYADGGTEKSPVIYRAVPGETVRIVGGKVISHSKFTKISDPQTLLLSASKFFR